MNTRTYLPAALAALSSIILPTLSWADNEVGYIEKFALAAESYRDNPVALHLRAMNMLYEAIKEKGAMVIVPSSVVETMGLGGAMATASLAGAKAPALPAPGN